MSHGLGALKNPVGKSYQPAVRSYFYETDSEEATLRKLVGVSS
jgi:hypothetical protein